MSRHFFRKPFSLYLVGVCAVFSPYRLYSQDVTFPAGFVKSIADWGLTGKEGTSVAGKIRQAIRECAGRNIYLYFPNGTYLLDSSLEWKKNDTKNNLPVVVWSSGLHIIGQSRNGTILKLIDNLSPEYQFDYSCKPKAMIITASDASENGAGVAGFWNHISNLTVDVGTGNPGAIGIDFIGNNVSGISNVNIIAHSQAYAGLAMDRGFPGPALMKDVSIQGFDYGVHISNDMYGVTFENLSLSGQRLNGILNLGNDLFIRNLTSNNLVPAVETRQWTEFQGSSPKPVPSLVLINAHLLGGSSANPGIINDGRLLLRDIVTDGYAVGLKNRGILRPGKSISEFVSAGDNNGGAMNTILSLGPTYKRTLKLPIEETPKYFDTDMTHWKSVKDFGAVSRDPGDPPTNFVDVEDQSASINAALASNYSTIYFPEGVYFVRNTLSVGPNIKHIIGNGAYICPVGTTFRYAQDPHAVIFLGDTVGNDVRIENLNFGRYEDANDPINYHPGAVFIDHRTNHTLTLSQLRFMPLDAKGDNAVIRNVYESREGAGKLFIEDVATLAAFGGWKFSKGQRIWARQLDLERSGAMNVDNQGGNLWVLGLKGENEQTLIATSNGGSTEVLGGWFMTNQPVGDVPAFTNDHGNQSLSFFYHNNDPDPTHLYTDLVRENRNGASVTLKRTDAVQFSGHFSVPLFTGYDKTAAGPVGCEFGTNDDFSAAIACLME